MTMMEGLEWNAPAGQWIVYRMGHATTGAEPHPVPDELIGKVLEADKMSAEQSTYHWKHVIDPVKEHLGEHIGKSFRHMLIDSYEAGGQNWTPGFREEFIKRKGYDPVPWLVSFSPAVTGGKQGKDRRIVGSKDQTARFDWDYRDVINQLFFENGWNIGKKMLNDAKLDLQFEPYTGPFSTPQGAALADIPMAEFWTSGTKGRQSGGGGGSTGRQAKRWWAPRPTRAARGEPIHRGSGLPETLHRHGILAGNQPHDFAPLGASAIRRQISARHGYGLVGYSF
jgi:hypothetical protein